MFNWEYFLSKLFRTLEDDLEVGGYLIPAGTMAVLCHLTMGQNKQVAERLDFSSPSHLKHWSSLLLVHFTILVCQQPWWLHPRKMDQDGKGICEYIITSMNDYGIHSSANTASFLESSIRPRHPHVCGQKVCRAWGLHSAQQNHPKLQVSITCWPIYLLISFQCVLASQGAGDDHPNSDGSRCSP